MAAIQKRLGEEFGLSATYMDTRFLILDLGIELQVETVAEEESAEGEAEPAAEAVAPAQPGGIQVSLDEITKPGAMVSGRIVFSDGEKALWWIDQMGRPGLDADTAGYRPSEEDLMAFEMELRRLLDQGGN